MLKRALMMGMMMVMALIAGLAVAADEDTPLDQGQQMPPMGPPAEMKECAALVGNWEAASEWRMSPEAEWQPSKGTAHFEYILDGGALFMQYADTTMMPGMKFEGVGVQTYDRENKHWQMTWTDNMGCRTSIFTGTRTVMTAEDPYMGQMMLSRITTSNETPTSYDWLIENSMDGGKTWFESGKSKYTKVK